MTDHYGHLERAIDLLRELKAIGEPTEMYSERVPHYAGPAGDPRTMPHTYLPWADDYCGVCGGSEPDSVHGRVLLPADDASDEDS